MSRGFETADYCKSFLSKITGKYETIESRDVDVDVSPQRAAYEKEKLNQLPQQRGSSDK